LINYRLRTIQIVTLRYKPEMRNPSGNVVIRVLRVIWTAIRGKRAASAAAAQSALPDYNSLRSSEEQKGMDLGSVSPVTSASSVSSFRTTSHWLDYAVPTFDRQLVEEVRCVLAILTEFLPVPFFWMGYVCIFYIQN
jgi:hypothetical protein